MRPLLKEELRGEVVEVKDEKYLDSMFSALNSESSISEFLESSGLYDNERRRWEGIQNAPKLERDLYEPFLKIMDAILSAFNYPAYHRELRDTHAIQVVHDEGECETVRVEEFDADGIVRVEELKSSPDFMVMGTGPNFYADTEKAATKTEYRYCASVGEIKTEANFKPADEDNIIVQVAVYARQCFIQQQNREFVWSLVLTEKFARLWQFDRGGVQKFPKFNYHEHPKAFVRFVLGFCQADLKAIGFDPSVKYEGEKRYITVANDWKDHGPALQTYQLAKINVAFSRRSLRGRGTVCWNAIFEGRLILIKDSWRAVERQAEFELLIDAVGLPGVAQMLAYHQGRRISDFRGVVGCEIPSFGDRVLNRVVMESYGPSIEKFEDRMQLLVTFRDAVAGHQNLWNHHILHRDISINNILHGKKYARPGNRGIIIDLDMAIRIMRDSYTMADFRTGTRAFQSIMVLKSGKLGVRAPPHDYLDDLESFFYVLTWICAVYTAPGKRQPVPEELAAWEDSPVHSAAQKYLFLGEAATTVTPYFGTVFKQLLTSLGEFLETHYRRKNRIANDPNGQFPPLMELMSASRGHYQTYLGYIDDAITDLQNHYSAAFPLPSETELTSIPHVPTTPPSHYTRGPFTDTPYASSARKRRAASDEGDIGEESPSSSKKSRHNRYTRADHDIEKIGDRRFLYFPGMPNHLLGMPLYPEHSPTREPLAEIPNRSSPLKRRTASEDHAFVKTSPSFSKNIRSDRPIDTGDQNFTNEDVRKHLTFDDSK